MKVVGFTFIRNALQFDYPIVEAIRSILPLCDEVVVAVGKSSDETLQLIQSLGEPKIRILETIWDDSLREGGQVLAEETNKAFDAIGKEADWCFYIQGDEVVHKKFYPNIRESMQRHLHDERVEGLLFDYLHFYGSYDFVGDSRRWYRREVRIIRNDNRIRSYRDAQGFRKLGQKLKVKPANASIYHYGWVKHPKYQQQKQRNFNKFWHSDNWVDSHVPDVSEFDYGQIDSLRRFQGTHPQVMQARVDKMNWQFTFDPTQRSLSLKERFSRWLEQMTGYRIGEYKNYVLLKE